jgi:hypothetical protein
VIQGCLQGTKAFRRITAGMDLTKMSRLLSLLIVFVVLVWGYPIGFAGGYGMALTFVPAYSLRCMGDVSALFKGMKFFYVDNYSAFLADEGCSRPSLFAPSPDVLPVPEETPEEPYEPYKPWWSQDDISLMLHGIGTRITDGFVQGRIDGATLIGSLFNNSVLFVLAYYLLYLLVCFILSLFVGEWLVDRWKRGSAGKP